jgi:hypothetical protein
MTRRTLPGLLESGAARFGGRVLLWEKREEAFHAATYGEVRGMVHRLAAGLIGQPPAVWGKAELP